MIDTKALRSRILDLAIQGKLTEQLPSEGVDTANISLLSEFPYTIPKNWKWTTIQSIISKDVGGGTPSKSMPEYWKNGDIPWMSVKDFSSAKNGVLEDTIDHITQAGLDNSSSNLVDEEAIIICMRMALGKIVKINKPMAINQDLRAIWLKPFIDNNYFVYFYSTLKVEGHGMTVAGISKAQLMSYPFPLPPLAEQKRIVERVEEIFRLLDTIDKAQEKYSADSQILKAKLITAGIQGKLTKQLESDGTAHELYQQIQAEKQKLIKEGKLKKEKPLPPISPDEIPFEIPQNWMWVRINDIFAVGTGSTPSKNEKKYYNGGDIPWVNSALTVNRYIEKVNTYITEYALNSLNLKLYAEHTLIIAMYGEGKTRGQISELLIPATTNQACAALSSIIYHQETINYVFYFFQNYYDSLRALAHGGNQPNLNLQKIKDVLIPLPPLAEQKRIADVLERALGVFE